MKTFADLGLLPALCDALAKEGYERPTPVQAQSIPALLAGRDVLACAQTGTGKTAAFALPVLQRLSGRAPAGGKPRIRALVLTPTRELAAQIEESFAAYGRFLALRHLVIFGGVSESPQVRALQAGCDILVATPGRLLDLHGRGLIDLRHVELFVLDEADRMLDMGFIHDVRKVLAHLPPRRQNLLFSATMPEAITQLAGSFLRDPARIAVTPEAPTVDRIDQSVRFLERPEKKQVLTELLARPEVERAIVFTRTKHGANRLAQQLGRAGIRAAAIHGNKSQNARRDALAGFKDGRIPVLVATDLASRGIDVDDVSHVFNFDLPNEPESYVHRIGRTARAGRSGVAISFCDASERAYLRDIERLIGRSLRVESASGRPIAAAQPHPAPAAAQRERASGDRRPEPRGGERRSGAGRSSRAPTRGEGRGRPSAQRDHAAAVSGGRGRGGERRGDARRATERGPQRAASPRPASGGSLWARAHAAKPAPRRDGGR